MQSYSSKIKTILARYGIANHNAVFTSANLTLEAINSALERILADADPRFTKICSDAQDLYNDTEFLRNHINHSLELIDLNNELSPFNQIDALSGMTLDAFHKTGISIRDSIKAVSSLKDEIETLAKLIQSFKDSSNYLKIIRSNISMESVRTEKSRLLFATLAKEIQELTTNINNIAAEMAEDLENALEKQHAAEVEIGGGIDKIFSLHELASEQISNAAQQAGDMVNISNEKTQLASKCFTNIAKNTSNVVIALQLHDIFRQQLEHVIEAGQEIQSRLTSEHKDKKQLAYAYKVTLLQAAQVSRVYDDVAKAYDDITESFNSIGNCLSKLSDQEESEKIVHNHHNSDVFFNLIDTLNHFNDYITTALSLSSRTSETIEMLRQTTNTLTSYIRQIRKISRELSIKALNAIVLTEKLGNDGKTLAVLTEEVYSNAGRAQKKGDEVTKVLSEITALSENLSDKNIDSNLKESTNKLQDAISLMDKNYKEFSEASQLTKNKVAEIRTRTTNTVNFLDFINTLLSMLQEQKDAFNSFLEDLKPYADCGDSETHNEIENLQSSYTMEQERQIHIQAISGNTQNNTAAADDSDNIELFTDDDQQEQLQPTAANNDDEEFDDNIELF